MSFVSPPRHEPATGQDSGSDGLNRTEGNRDNREKENSLFPLLPSVLFGCPSKTVDRHLRVLRKYWNICRVSLIERLTYRADFFLATILRFLPMLTTILLWQAVYAGANATSGQQQLSGFTFDEMVAYLLLVHISRMFSSMPGLAAGKLASHALDFWLTSEDLPRPENRVMVDRDGHIRLHYTPNNLDAHNRLTRKLRHLLNYIGCEPHLLPQNAYFGKRIPIAGTGHQNGTIRFGQDPADSALDINCRAHELDNLYVVDGSFFVSSAAVNPTLTIIANALRIGDHLLERLGAPSAVR